MPLSKAELIERAARWRASSERAAAGMARRIEEESAAASSRNSSKNADATRTRQEADSGSEAFHGARQLSRKQRTPRPGETETEHGADPPRPGEASREQAATGRDGVEDKNFVRDGPPTAAAAPKRPERPKARSKSLLSSKSPSPPAPSSVPYDENLLCAGASPAIITTGSSPPAGSVDFVQSPSDPTPQTRFFINSSKKEFFEQQEIPFYVDATYEPAVCGVGGQEHPLLRPPYNRHSLSSASIARMQRAKRTDVLLSRGDPCSSSSALGVAAGARSREEGTTTTRRTPIEVMPMHRKMQERAASKTAEDSAPALRKASGARTTTSHSRAARKPRTSPILGRVGQAQMQLSTPVLGTSCTMSTSRDTQPQERQRQITTGTGGATHLRTTRISATGAERNTARAKKVTSARVISSSASLYSSTAGMGGTVLSITGSPNPFQTPLKRQDPRIPVQVLPKELQHTQSESRPRGQQPQQEQRPFFFKPDARKNNVDEDDFEDLSRRREASGRVMPEVTSFSKNAASPIDDPVHYPHGGGGGRRSTTLSRSRGHLSERRPPIHLLETANSRARRSSAAATSSTRKAQPPVAENDDARSSPSAAEAGAGSMLRTKRQAGRLAAAPGKDATADVRELDAAGGSPFRNPGAVLSSHFVRAREDADGMKSTGTNNVVQTTALDGTNNSSFFYWPEELVDDAISDEELEVRKLEQRILELQQASRWRKVVVKAPDAGSNEKWTLRLSATSPRNSAERTSRDFTSSLGINMQPSGSATTEGASKRSDPVPEVVRTATTASRCSRRPAPSSAGERKNGARTSSSWTENVVLENSPSKKDVSLSKLVEDSPSTQERARLIESLLSSDGKSAQHDRAVFAFDEDDAEVVEMRYNARIRGKLQNADLLQKKEGRGKDSSSANPSDALAAELRRSSSDPDETDASESEQEQAGARGAADEAGPDKGSQQKERGFAKTEQKQEQQEAQSVSPPLFSPDNLSQQGEDEARQDGDHAEQEQEDAPVRPAFLDDVDRQLAEQLNDSCSSIPDHISNARSKTRSTPKRPTGQKTLHQTGTYPAAPAAGRDHDITAVRAAAERKADWARSLADERNPPLYSPSVKFQKLHVPKQEKPSKKSSLVFSLRGDAGTPMREYVDDDAAGRAWERGSEFSDDYLPEHTLEDKPREAREELQHGQDAKVVEVWASAEAKLLDERLKQLKIRKEQRNRQREQWANSPLALQHKMLVEERRFYEGCTRDELRRGAVHRRKVKQEYRETVHEEDGARAFKQRYESQRRAQFHREELEELDLQRKNREHKQFLYDMRAREELRRAKEIQTERVRERGPGFSLAGGVGAPVATFAGSGSPEERQQMPVAANKCLPPRNVTTASRNSEQVQYHERLRARDKEELAARELKFEDWEDWEDWDDRYYLYANNFDKDVSPSTRKWYFGDAELNEGPAGSGHGRASAAYRDAYGGEDGYEDGTGGRGTKRASSAAVGRSQAYLVQSKPDEEGRHRDDDVHLRNREKARVKAERKRDGSVFLYASDRWEDEPPVDRRDLVKRMREQPSESPPGAAGGKDYRGHRHGDSGEGHSARPPRKAPVPQQRRKSARGNPTDGAAATWSSPHDAVEVRKKRTEDRRRQYEAEKDARELSECTFRPQTRFTSQTKAKPKAPHPRPNSRGLPKHQVDSGETYIDPTCTSIRAISVPGFEKTAIRMRLGRAQRELADKGAHQTQNRTTWGEKLHGGTTCSPSDQAERIRDIVLHALGGAEGSETAAEHRASGRGRGTATTKRTTRKGKQTTSTDSVTKTVEEILRYVRSNNRGHDKPNNYATSSNRSSKKTTTSTSPEAHAKASTASATEPGENNKDKEHYRAEAAKDMELEEFSGEEFVQPGRAPDHRPVANWNEDRRGMRATILAQMQNKKAQAVVNARNAPVKINPLFRNQHQEHSETASGKDSGIVDDESPEDASAHAANAHRDRINFSKRCSRTNSSGVLEDDEPFSSDGYGTGSPKNDTKSSTKGFIDENVSEPTVGSDVESWDASLMFESRAAALRK